MQRYAGKSEDSKSRISLRSCGLRLLNRNLVNIFVRASCTLTLCRDRLQLKQTSIFCSFEDVVSTQGRTNCIQLLRVIGGHRWRPALVAVMEFDFHFGRILAFVNDLRVFPRFSIHWTPPIWMGPGRYADSPPAIRYAYPRWIMLELLTRIQLIPT